MGTITLSTTVIPSGTTDRTNMTTSTSYPESRGYNNTSNTSFARWTLSTSTAGHIYYTFDTSEIPAGATITGVTAKARCYVNNTTRVTNTVCQLYSGTTAKGSNTTFASTSNANIVTLSTGSSWTRSDLNDLRIRIGATGSSSTSSKYVYFAGAEVVISYSAAAYDITIQNSTTATVTASESEVVSGSEVEIFSDTLTGLTIKDNGTDVTSQFVHGISDTMSAVPGSAFTTGFSQSGANFYQSSSTTSTSWLQYAIGHSAESPYSTSDTNNTYVKPEGATGWINYMFDFSEIPTSATINSVSVKVYGARENSTVDTSHVARFQCYSGSTAKGTLQNFTSASNGAVTVSDVGTWTATELHDAQLRFEIGYYGGRMLGITWTVSYTLDGYVYTISNISTDHTIVVTSGGVTETIWYKAGGGSEVLAGTKRLSDESFNVNLSVDLSSFASGDSCRVSGTIYMEKSGSMISGTDADIGCTFTWTGSDYVYTANFSSGTYTITVNPSYIKVQTSNQLGALSASPYNEAGERNIGFYKSSGGGWIPAIKVYKKVNGSWVQQSNLANVFDANTNYVKG